MRSIKVKIDKKGNIKLDFVGFVDGDCFEESDKLKKALAKFGLEVGEGGIVRTKSQQEIASESESTSSKEGILI